MKTLISLCALALVSAFSPAAFAADEHAGHGMTPAKAAAMSSMTDGVIKKLDRTSGKLTLTHGPLLNLGMPAMTMAFRVEDKAWLKSLKDGDKVRFMAEELNGALTITHLERAR